MTQQSLKIVRSTYNIRGKQILFHGFDHQGLNKIRSVSVCHVVDKCAEKLYLKK